ncbi:MAG: DUF1697 domain-containing protein [Gemmatimonadaceae bacterium]
MKRYFCFLRAINVGGHTVTMQALKKMFEQMGFADVETFIASGNVIFNSAHRDSGVTEPLISKHLKGALGYEVAVFVRTRDELEAVEAFKPVAADRIKSALSYHVGFCDKHFDYAGQKKVAAFSTDSDDLKAKGREIYWVAQTRFSDSTVSSGGIEKAIGRKATFRNINTVRRLLDKYPAIPNTRKKS